MGLALSRGDVRRSITTLLAALAALAALGLRARYNKQKGRLPPSPAAAEASSASCSPGTTTLPPRPTRAPPPCKPKEEIPPRPTRPPPGGEALPPRPTRPPPTPDAPADKEASASRPCPTPTRAASAAPPSTGNTSEVELWICLDFEWTCDEGEDRQLSCEDGEIIEFAYAIYDSVARKSVCDGQHFCKNQKTPITGFCTELTGITQEKLADAGTLQDALVHLQNALSQEGLAGRPCCAVTHGSADLELMLPLNCKAQGLELPSALRKYVDLREATQSHLTSKGVRGARASTLRQICEALKLEMIGSEHCGLDDAWMVLLAMQQLIQNGADLQAVDLDAEQETFLGGRSPDNHRLCLDGLPFFATVSEVRPWLEGVVGCEVADSSLLAVLGLDGRPSGRAVVGFGSHEAAVQAYKALEGGRRYVFGPPQTLPASPWRERLILARPLRRQELCLQYFAGEKEAAGGPGLVPLLPDEQAVLALRTASRARRRRVEPAEGCEGTVKNFNSGRGFGFIETPDGDVFFHVSDCRDLQLQAPREGDTMTFDVVEDPFSKKIKAINVVRVPRT